MAVSRYGYRIRLTGGLAAPPVGRRSSDAVSLGHDSNGHGVSVYRVNIRIGYGTHRDLHLAPFCQLMATPRRVAFGRSGCDGL